MRETSRWRRRSPLTRLFSFKASLWPDCRTTSASKLLPAHSLDLCSIFVLLAIFVSASSHPTSLPPTRRQTPSLSRLPRLFQARSSYTAFQHANHPQYLYTLRNVRGGAYPSRDDQGYGRGGYPPYDDDYGDDFYDTDSYYPPPPPPPSSSRNRNRASGRPSSPPTSPRGRPGSSASASSFRSLVNEPVPPSLKRLGFTLLGASLVLTAMGVSLFFERNLLRLGNLCLIVGLPLYFGPGRVMRLLVAREKLRASVCFCLGVLLVLRGNSFLGMLLEVFGFFNLFANFFPVVLALLRGLPVVGDLLKRPERGPGSGGGRGKEYYGQSGRGTYRDSYQGDYGDRW